MNRRNNVSRTHTKIGIIHQISMMTEAVAGRIFLSRQETVLIDFFKDEPWHRVETAGSPGMAPGDAPGSHPTPSDRAVQPQCIDGIE